MKKKTNKAHGSKSNTQKITKNKLQVAAEHKRATGVQQPKKGVKVTALNKKKRGDPQVESGGLVTRHPAKPAAKEKSKKNPYTVQGNKKSKNDTENGPNEVLASSSSPTYIQQSKASLNKTRLSKPSAHLIQESETDETNDDQNEKNFPDQANMGEDERGMKEDNL